MFLPRLGSLFASLVATAQRVGRTIGSPPSREGRLIVLRRTTKVMRPAHLDRRGRYVPAVEAPLLICTHRATGKAWPRHRTNRVRKAVAA